MRLRLSLTGNPNCGKTTLYNMLTGEEETVGNWSGVTVSASEVEMSTAYGIATIVDLPGTYSLSAYSKEEALTLGYINPENSDVIVNIVDITNLSRSLYFTTQLIELGLPMIVALNKVDILEEEVDTRALARALGCPVIPISAQRGDSLREMVTLSATASRPAKREPMADDVARFAWIEEILSQVYVTKKDNSQMNGWDKFDQICMTPLTGIPIFLGLLWGIFFISQGVVGQFFSSLLGDILFGTVLNSILNTVFQFIPLPHMAQELVIEGIFGSAGMILRFLPLIMCLFFLLALLEDCGYLARVTVLLNGAFHKIGLSGKAILPLVVGIGSSQSGVLATRTLSSHGQRVRLALLSPFVICGRKFPLIALFSFLFFHLSWWFLPSLYLVMGCVLFFVGYLLKLLFPQEKEESYFIMELSQYRKPRLTLALGQMYSNTWTFLKRVLCFVVPCNLVLFLLMHLNWQLHLVEATSESLLAQLGMLFSPLFQPLGLGAWQLVVVSLAGFLAKENCVSTLWMIYAGETLLLQGNSLLSTYPALSMVTAMSFLYFQLFSLPCYDVIRTFQGEIGEKKLFYLGLLIQFSTGYLLCFGTFQIGTLLTTGAMDDSFALGLGIVAVLLGSVWGMVKCWNVAELSKEEVVEEEISEGSSSTTEAPEVEENPGETDKKEEETVTEASEIGEKEQEKDENE